MKKNEKMLSLPQWIVAIVAVIALAIGTFLLYNYTLVNLAWVFAPLAIALIGGAVLVLINRKLFDVAGALTLAALAVDAVLLVNNGIQSVKGLVAWLPLIVFFLAFCTLRDVAATKESIRKFFVSLKRNPQYIPLVMMFVTFLVYSLNLTSVSNTTAKIQGTGMGLSQFCIMLFSLLSMVCMLNAFPRRKKANIPMVVLMFVMFGVIIFCDYHYQNLILAATGRKENPIKITSDTLYIQEAFDMLGLHMILVIATAALVALLPVFKKLLKKINTSVAVEYGDDMAEIEINE